MKVRIDVGKDTDLVALVSRDEFMQYVDPDDLACRESVTVLDWYHPSWFRWDDFTGLHFTPPAFEFRNGCACWINGRHRTVLLFRHQQFIPMLIVEPDLWPFSTLAQFVRQVIEEGEFVDVPDLAIKWDAPADLEWPDLPSGQVSVPKVDIRINLGDDEVSEMTLEERPMALPTKAKSKFTPVFNTGDQDSAAASQARGKNTTRDTSND